VRKFIVLRKYMSEMVPSLLSSFCSLLHCHLCCCCISTAFI